MIVLAIIPAHDEERFIGKIVRETKKYVDLVLVIDDGSNDNTSITAKQNGAEVIRHKINKGLGCALRTGIEHALKIGADIIITLDGDGQHDPHEIHRLTKPLINGEADFVIGSRFLSPDFAMPLERRVSNILSTAIIKKITKFDITDSQSGFRAFTSKSLRRMRLKTEKMDIATEFILEAKNAGLKIKEVPIKLIYGEEKSSFRNIRDTLLFIRLLLSSSFKRWGSR